MPQRRRYNGTMQIVLNGQPYECPAPTTVAGLLEAIGLGHKRVAVEVNQRIVPRSRHATLDLAPDDRVEIVHAIGGG